MTESAPATDAVFVSRQDGTPDDPVGVLDRWVLEAKNRAGFIAMAMSLATSTPQGDPDVRIVLMQAVHEGALVFFTNLTSVKGHQLRANPKAAACFHWPAMGRQARIRGSVREVDEHYADRYFAARPRGSQIGAHASPQSQPIADRATLVRLVEDAQARFMEEPVPRPAFWTGLALIPAEIEFWEDGVDRLHDRVLFRRAPDGAGWNKAWLAP